MAYPGEERCPLYPLEGRARHREMARVQFNGRRHIIQYPSHPLKSSHPGHISNDHENADGGHGRQGKGHPELDENSNKGQTPLHADGLTPFAIRTSASEFSGPEAILVSMKAHLEHSKVRFSVPSGRGAMVVRSMRVLHRTQRGRSIGDSRTSVRDEVMAHLCLFWEGGCLKKVKRPPFSVCPEPDLTIGIYFFETMEPIGQSMKAFMPPCCAFTAPAQDEVDTDDPTCRCPARCWREPWHF